jgi:hypothetical protein
MAIRVFICDCFLKMHPEYKPRSAHPERIAFMGLVGFKAAVTLAFEGRTPET